jgi:ribose-phosphate pyrophosphokinase
VTGRDLALFALSGGEGLGGRVAEALGVPLDPHEERGFEDGEHKARPLASVRGRHAVLIGSLHGDAAMSVNDRLCRALFFCAALRDAGAAEVTLVAPYLCYARKDRRTKSRDPVTTRYVAQAIEAMGVDRVVAMDVHNPAAFENAFRRPVEHLEARPLLVRHLAPLLGGDAVTVVAPDAGGAKRADALRAALSAALRAPAGSAYAEKRRGDLLAGEVEGTVAVIVDDLISTGTTLARTARRCRERGAARVLAAATHAVLPPGAGRALADPALDAVIVTDTVPPGGGLDRLVVLGVAPFLAEAIRRIHEGGSLVALHEEWTVAAIPGGAG